MSCGVPEKKRAMTETIEKVAHPGVPTAQCRLSCSDPGWTVADILWSSDTKPAIQGPSVGIAVAKLGLRERGS